METGVLACTTSRGRCKGKYGIRKHVSEYSRFLAGTIKLLFVHCYVYLGHLVFFESVLHIHVLLDVLSNLRLPRHLL